ncbi:MAG: CARDB domain-containing protein [Ignavibacteriaceae bacterium]|nr:CARDB domain-containing protein [Ignavibacteriaceae bacterium]
MVRKITILSLFLLLTVNLFAQNVVIHKKSSSSIFINKPITSLKKSNNGNQNGIQSLYYVLPSDNYYLLASTASLAPTGQSKYERCVYLIKPSEMQALGIPSGVKVNQIAWTYYLLGAASVTGSIKIYLQNTTDVTSTKVSSWATDISPMTLVDNNSSFMIANTAYSIIENFSLPTAFSYTGGGVYVAFDYSATTTTTGCGVNITDVSAGTSGSRCNQSSTALPTTVANTYGAYRPETYLGFSIANDMEVMQIYTLGKLPIPFAAPHQIKAVIANNGSSTVTNKNVTLMISGANTYSEVIQIASIDPGNNTEVIFSNWTPTNAGTNIITVTIPSDDINLNNSKTVNQLITTNTFNYAYGPFPPTADGGVGFNSGTGDLAAKFSTNSVSTIDKVSVGFDTAGKSYKIGIWDATGTAGSPGTLLWQSATQTSIAGIDTITVSPKIHVSGSFFVGISQTGTTNLYFDYQIEKPIRAGIFYFAAPSGSLSWNDFAPGNNFRLMIEPILTLIDVGVSGIANPVGGAYNNLTTNIAPIATVTNFGGTNQTSPFNVIMNIYDTLGTQVYTSTKSISSLNSGVSQQVTFDATFNPTAKYYKAKCFTALAADADKTNDTTTNYCHYNHFSLSVKALMQGLFDGSSMVSDTVTVELRDTTAPYLLQSSQKLVLNSSGLGIGFPTSPLNSISHYYVVVKHRNSIETWSAVGNIFISSALNYDFTTSAAQAYGNNLILKGNKYCLYSGDINQDGQINLLDLVAVFANNSNYVNGYSSSDVDGNNIVDLADLLIVDNNYSANVSKQTPPGASEIKQPKNPIINLNTN